MAGGDVRIADLIERVVWTFVAAFLGVLVLELARGGYDVIGDVLRSALVAGVVAAGTAVLVIARWRLSVLPDPGSFMNGPGRASSKNRHPSGQ